LLLGTIGRGHSYDDLIGDTIELEIGKRLRVRVLKLETLIKVKAETAREKDKLALLILRRTLQERTAKS
jgi:predicted nucleotidyltransferase